MFKKVSIDDCAALRTRILRPHFTGDQVLIRDVDRLETTHHFALFDENPSMVACVTFAKKECKRSPGADAVQLTAMAVDSDFQRQGLGRELVEKSLDVLPPLYPNHRLLWCNAREYAVPFYETLSFQCWGERFDIKDVGPHFIMWREL